MYNRIASVKQKLDTAITQLCEKAGMFSKNPGKDFSRNRKLPFRTVISLLLSKEGGTLKTELLDFFGSLLCRCRFFLRFCPAEKKDQSGSFPFVVSNVCQEN